MLLQKEEIKSNTLTRCNVLLGVGRNHSGRCNTAHKNVPDQCVPGLAHMISTIELSKRMLQEIIQLTRKSLLMISRHLKEKDVTVQPSMKIVTKIDKVGEILCLGI